MAFHRVDDEIDISSPRTNTHIRVSKHARGLNIKMLAPHSEPKHKAGQGQTRCLSLGRAVFVPGRGNRPRRNLGSQMISQIERSISLRHGHWHGSLAAEPLDSVPPAA